LASFSHAKEKVTKTSWQGINDKYYSYRQMTKNVDNNFNRI